MGDAAGISPEIILKAALTLKNAPIIAIGCAKTFAKCKEALGIKIELNPIKSPEEAKFEGKLNVIDIALKDPDALRIGQVQAQSGELAYKALEHACMLALKGQVAAIATAPLNKEALHLAGYMYPGHTEILAKLSDTKDYAMLLYTKELKIIHVSTHVSMRGFLDKLNEKRIDKVIEIAHNFMQKCGYKHPRIALAGINPHAGENGLFGSEEQEFLLPCIKRAKEAGLEVSGPWPADTVFLRAKNGEFDIVLAMYHDQGHIPLKLLGFFDGVNITAGLPFLRTSPDHGTAHDIAWKGLAREESMIGAIKLAWELI